MDVLPEDSPLYPIAARIVEAVEQKQLEFRHVSTLEDDEKAEILQDVVAALLQDEVLDGRTDQTQIKLRLYGIDAPEKKQAFGTRAKQNLSDLVFGKDAKLVTVNKDRYDRTVAWVYVGDINTNEEQVKAGFAWWYQAYAKHEQQLQNFEREAREARRGLWSETNNPPWEFRKKKLVTNRQG